MILLEVLFYSSFSYSIQYIITFLYEQKSDQLKWLFSFLICGFFIAICSAFTRSRLYAKVSSQLVGDIRRDIFEKINRLPILEIEKSGTGSLLTEYENVVSLSNAMPVFATGFIYALFSFVINALIMASINLKLTLIAIVIIPILVFLPRSIVLKKFLPAMPTEDSQFTAFTLENIIMQPTIRIFGLHDQQLEVFEKKSAMVDEENFINHWGNNVTISFADLIPTSMRIMLLGIGSYFVMHNQMAVPALISFEFVFSVLIFAFIRLYYCISTIKIGYEAVNKLVNFLKIPISESLVTQTIETAPFLESSEVPSLSFEEVSFGYGDGKHSVIDLNFSISPKSFIAFVGPSGSGKSTIMNLILGLYPILEGKIKIDALQIEGIPKEDFYRFISYVPQEAALFNTSIYENIRLGKLDATKSEIEYAVQLAGLTETIEGLPRKYETLVGENGKRLSGGQRQRVAIARALIHKPKILVLDEITSSLDPFSEAAINQTILSIAKQCTVILVTHRLAIAASVDRIYVLNHGKIVESGNHAQLLAKSGIYKDLWEQQHLFKALELQSPLTISVDQLRKVSLFADFPEESLKMIHPLIKPVFLPADTIIFEKDDLSDAFYLIVQGAVKIIHGPLKDSSHPTILSDGDYFGELGLLKRKDRSATAVTVTNCLLLSLTHKRFHQVLRMYPILAEKLEERIRSYWYNGLNNSR
jgi:ATP-binding cassette subfamily B protein